jgi:hypothetical protein
MQAIGRLNAAVIEFSDAYLINNKMVISVH